MSIPEGVNQLARAARGRARASRGGRRLALAALAVVVAVPCVSGCFDPFRPRVGSGLATVEAAPIPSSPQGALRLLQWCWVNRQISEYEELFTNDFQFVFSDIEAIDNPPILQFEEIAIAKRLFVDGTANEPRAKHITLEFTNSLRPIADQRPGKDPPWHQQITTGVSLRAELQDEIFNIDGNVVFYLVRGDVAVLPQTLIDRGFGKNPSRWYIEEWEDKTSTGQSAASLVEHLLATRTRVGVTPAAPAPAALDRSRSTPLDRSRSTPLDALPTRSMTWGDLKVLYRKPS